MPDELPRSPLRIIGTSHISERSVKEIRRAVEEFSPDIIAVELDKRRLEGLDVPPEQRTIPFSLAKQVGVTGWLFLRLGAWLQRKLGAIVKVQPGVDMRAAIQLGKERGILVALVDQDIMVTMRRLSAAFTFRWKMRILWDIISGPFRKRLRIPLKGVPDDKTLKFLMGLLRERYPPLYTVLIEERNIHMCVKLDRISRARPGSRILLVVGAGHVEDLRQRLTGSARFSISDGKEA